jgi:hypothetical protein
VLLTDPVGVAARRMRKGASHTRHSQAFRIGPEHRCKPLQLDCHGDRPGPAGTSPPRDGDPGLEKRHGFGPQGGVGGHKLRERDAPLNGLPHDPPDELVSLAERHPFLHQPLGEVRRGQSR